MYIEKMTASILGAKWSLQVLFVAFTCQVVLIAAKPTHPCLDCPAGQGAIQPCNSSHDTLCHPCPLGHYSPEPSPTLSCLACSRCGDGLFELHPCTAQHDLFCELCTWTQALDNVDYIKKCTKSKSDKSGTAKEVYVTQDHGKHKGGRRHLSIKGILQKLRHNGKFNGGDVMLGDSGLEDLRFGDAPAENKDTNLRGDLPEKAQEPESKVALVGEIDKESQVTTLSPLEGGGKVEEGMNPVGTNKEEGQLTTENYDRNDVTPDSEDQEKPLPELFKPNVTGATLIPDKATTYMPNNADMGSSSVPELNNNVTVPNENSADTATPDINATTSNLQTKTSDVPIVDESEEGVSSSPTLNPSETVGTIDFMDPDDPMEGSGESGGSGMVDLPEDNELPDFNVDIDIPKTTTTRTVAKTTYRHPKPKSTPVLPFDDEDEDSYEDAEVVEPEVQASTVEEEVPVVGIIIAVITCGILFFALGFFASRYRNSSKGPPRTPKPEYKPQVIYNRPNGMLPSQHQMSDLNGSNNGTGTGGYDEPDDMMVGPGYEEETEALTTADHPYIGKYQSPVDIDPDDADIDDRLEKTPLTIQYIPEHTKCITNTGNTIRVDADGRDSVLSGGPLNSKKYRLDHFHFHWGKENSCGSEHTIKGCQYSAEIHLVHWNAEDYPNFAEAAKGEDGLAVIAVLIKVDDKENSGMKTLTDCLPSIQYKGESRELPENRFDPKALFPKNTVDYWTYMGSLTTPPYYETVTWIIMKDSISVTQEQIDNFRSLLTYERGEGHLVKDRDQAYMGNNFRKTLPLEDRVIHASFV